jgi:excisionase family DNA binding protein
MARESQFGVRKNPAPQQRQHGSRLAAEIVSETALVNQNLPIPDSLISNSQKNEAPPPLHAAPHHAATGERGRDDSRLLNVSEVAQLLQVPISWIYARTRYRTKDRLPGYRLGKYWRFDRSEVLAWVESQRRDSHAA